MKIGHDQKKLYEFEGFRLDTSDGKLWRGTQQIALTHKAIDLLTLLVEQRGETLSKNEIIERLWRDTFVDENNLAVTVSTLRKAFGERANENRFIETVPRRGYRFVADVREAEGKGFVIEKQTETRITVSETEQDEPDSKKGARLLSHRGGNRSLIFAALIIVSGIAAGYFFLKGNVSGKNQVRSVLPSDAPRKIAVLPFGGQIFEADAPDETKLGANKAAADFSAVVAERFGSGGQMTVTPFEGLSAERASIDNFLIVGKKLGVEAVLLGKFFELSERKIYLRVHLVGVGDGEILWAHTYDVPRTGEQALLADLEHNTLENLRKLAAPDEYARRAREHTPSEEAFQLYLQGRFSWKMRNDLYGSYTGNYNDYEQALKLDPNFALPYVGLADGEKVHAFHENLWQRAEENARRALALKPDLADARAALGFIKMFHHWDWAGAESEFQQAIAADAECLSARQWYALMLALQERHREAQQQIARARQIAPHSVSIRKDEGEMQYLARLHTEAIIIGEELEKDLAHSQRYSWSLWQMGEYEKAVRQFIIVGDAGDETEALRAFREGGKNGFLRYMHALTDKTGNAFRQNSYFLAIWKTALGEREEALALLEQAAESHEFFVVYIKANPIFKDLRDEPRFKEILRRVGLEN